MLPEFPSRFERFWPGSRSWPGANRSCAMAAKGSSAASANRAILAIEHLPLREAAIGAPLARIHVLNATTADCAAREFLPVARGFAFPLHGRLAHTICGRRAARAGIACC